MSAHDMMPAPPAGKSDPRVPFPTPPHDENWPVTRVCTKCSYRWGQS